MNAAMYPLASINRLLVPMNELVTAQPPPPVNSLGVTSSGEKISPRSVPLSEIPGIPTLQYQIKPESIEIVAIQLAEK